MEQIELINPNELAETEVLMLLREHPEYIVDRVEQTEERCITAVQQAGYLLQSIPKSMQTYDVCLAAVSQNGYAIKYVSKRLICDELCIEAVRNNPRALCYIPEEFLNSTLLNAAIAADGSAIQYVPECKRTDELCRNAIFQNSAALQYVPKRLLTKDLFLQIVPLNGLTLEYMPGNIKSKALCESAVQNNPLALEFVPNRFKSPEMCEKAVRADWRAFAYVPEKLITLNNCVKYLQYIAGLLDNPGDKGTDDLQDIVSHWPGEVNESPQVVELERQLKIRYFTKKYYDSQQVVFITEEYVGYTTENEVREHASFAAFYEYLMGDLQNADLYGYDFHGVDLSQYSVEGARIRSDVLVEQGLYDPSIYNQLVFNSAGFADLRFSEENELIPAETVLHELDTDTGLNDSSRKLYYISDLHLNHKLLERYPTHATRCEIVEFIRQVVDELVVSATDANRDDYLLIAGDISFSFEVSAIFYWSLAEKWPTHNIIVTLGNHELWDCDYNTPQYGAAGQFECIQRYRKLCSELDITFLHNELFVLIDGQKVVVSEEQLLTIEPVQLKRLCLKSSLIVLGGLGYSGYNPEFNASKGIYRDAVKNLQDDLFETKRFEAVYEKLTAQAGEYRVVVLTHTPKSNWSKQAYNSNWVYVNGHTHRNLYYCDEKRTVYADNQIGYYHRNSVGLKFFRLPKTYDIFKCYSDGIYTISREQYLEFNRGQQISVSFNRNGGRIQMLKHSGIYCFVYENDSGKYLLNGGSIKSVKHYDLSYYYDRLPMYAALIKHAVRDYYAALKVISDAVKKIGGDGTIHGCIIDIDFLNHIYIDPKTGKITPYYAMSIVKKYKYPDVRTLLLENRKDLYDNYIRLINGFTSEQPYLEGSANVPTPFHSEYVSETYMYRPSRIMRSIQYLTETNVVRIWDEELLEKEKRLEKSKPLLEA